MKSKYKKMLSKLWDIIGYTTTILLIILLTLLYMKGLLGLDPFGLF